MSKFCQVTKCEETSALSGLQTVFLLQETGVKELSKIMNWDQVEGNWKQVKGKAREKWGKLTDNDWEQVAGKKDQLIGRIQERYGITKEEAQKQADEWARAQEAQARETEHTTKR